jgi:HAMP domain-containing protein
MTAHDTDQKKRPGRNLKSLVIEPFKQIKFGLYVIGICVAFLGICGLMFVTAFTQQYQHVMSIFNVIDPKMKWELVTNDVFYTNAIRIGVLFASFIGVLFFVVFRMTHRYYGPLVSVQRFIESMEKGDYSKRCKIRTKDELHDLVDQLNSMADSLEKRHGSGVKSDDVNSPWRESARDVS